MSDQVELNVASKESVAMSLMLKINQPALQPDEFQGGSRVFYKVLPQHQNGWR